MWKHTNTHTADKERKYGLDVLLNLKESLVFISFDGFMSFKALY